jgi:hypothetical protein
MFNQRPVVEHKLWTANSIAAGQNESTAAIDLRQIAQDGTFSIKYTVTGTGTCKFEYNLCDTKTGTFIEPSGASDIASSITASSGTSGTDWVSFSPILAPFMKIKCTETGSSNAVVVTLSVFTQ